MNAPTVGSVSVETSRLHFSLKSSIDHAWIVCVLTLLLPSAVTELKTMRRVAGSIAGVPVTPIGWMLPHPAPVFCAGVPALLAGIDGLPVVSSSA